ncbi:uncharacterized protein LOC118738602 [Rhagoletis pomonella]|uniref:uncharacterized protein LOC118738602 n=1 Tax=Rhagoletis pomonella TaxID=28610 RepID=UPI001782F8DB|nr:uncharacterized protein LOC118738602 [Rhagoletis pomonella]
MRSWEKLLKVWTNLKSKTKKKVSENISDFPATGGGQNNLHTLTPLEEAVVNFLKYDICLNPPGEEIGSSASRAHSVEINEQENFFCEIIGEALGDSDTRGTQECEIEPQRISKQRKKNCDQSKKDWRFLKNKYNVNRNILRPWKQMLKK